MTLSFIFIAKYNYNSQASLNSRANAFPGANRTTLSYNASVVKIYSTTNAICL
jgi:hypothetical protein